MREHRWSSERNEIPRIYPQHYWTRRQRVALPLAFGGFCGSPVTPAAPSWNCKLVVRSYLTLPERYDEHLGRRMYHKTGDKMIAHVM